MTQQRVQVAVRLRPPLASQLQVQSVNTLQGGKVQVNVLSRDAASSQRQAARVYNFDVCLDGFASQADVFEACKVGELVEAALAGFGVTIFAFGQTGSGKTYSVTGPRLGTLSEDLNVQSIEPQDGLLSRTIHQAFAAIKSRTTDSQYTVTASCCELYKESVTDLLINGRQPLSVRRCKESGFYVEGLKQFPCASAGIALRYMNRALAHRHTRSHKLNQDSSRSHCIMTLHLQSEAGGCRRLGFLRLVDLAGSERLKDSGIAGGLAGQETGFINRSLFALGQVLSGLGQQSGKPAVLPYRDTVLTRLLWDGLRGNGRILMLACVAPDQACVDETKATLAFAAAARRIKSLPVVLLAPGDQVLAELRQTISRLRRENLRLSAALTQSTAAVTRSAASGAMLPAPLASSAAVPAVDVLDLDNEQVQAGHAAMEVERLHVSRVDARRLPGRNIRLPQTSAGRPRNHNASPFCNSHTSSLRLPRTGGGQPVLQRMGTSPPQASAYPELEQLEAEFQRSCMSTADRAAGVPHRQLFSPAGLQCHLASDTYHGMGGAQQQLSSSWQGAGVAQWARDSLDNASIEQAGTWNADPVLNNNDGQPPCVDAANTEAAPEPLQQGSETGASQCAARETESAAVGSSQPVSCKDDLGGVRTESAVSQAADGHDHAPARAHAMATEWAAQNSWFGSDSEMTAFAYKVHDTLVLEGFDPEGDPEAYYSELGRRVQRHCQPQQHKHAASVAGRPLFPMQATSESSQAAVHGRSTRGRQPQDGRMAEPHGLQAQHRKSRSGSAAQAGRLYAPVGSFSSVLSADATGPSGRASGCRSLSALQSHSGRQTPDWQLRDFYVLQLQGAKRRAEQERCKLLKEVKRTLQGVGSWVT